MNIKAHILGQLAANKDIADVVLVAWANNNGVMAHIGPFQLGPFGAEIPNEEAHRPPLARQFRPRPALARVIAQKPVIGVACVRVRHHQIGSKHLTICQAHPRGAAVLKQDLIHLGIQPQGPALRSDHPRHGQGNRPHPAHRIVNPEFLLEVANEDIHRRHMERIAANEQRMERQRKAQTLILNTGGGMGVNRLVSAQQGKGRQHLDEISQTVHRPAAQIFKAEPIAPFAVIQELVIARQIPRREPRHFSAHRLGRLAGGKGRPILPANLVKRIQRPQIDIAVKIAPAGRPQLA